MHQRSHNWLMKPWKCVRCNSFQALSYTLHIFSFLCKDFNWQCVISVLDSVNYINNLHEIQSSCSHIKCYIFILTPQIIYGTQNTPRNTNYKVDIATSHILEKEETLLCRLEATSPKWWDKYITSLLVNLPIDFLSKYIQRETSYFIVKNACIFGGLLGI